MVNIHKQRLYDKDGQWVSLDDRYSINKEGAGYPNYSWVIRFCDDFIAAHETQREAIQEALKWEMTRVKRMLGLL